MAASAFTRSMHRTHRALGSVLAPLIGLWFASGAVMTFSKYPHLSEAERLALAPPLVIASKLVLPTSLLALLSDDAFESSLRLRLAMHEGAPTWLYRARDGTRTALRAFPSEMAPLTEARARSEAARRFGLPIAESERLDRSDQWTVALANEKNLPFYRVRFADPQLTEVYLSARTGELMQLSTRTERTLAWLGAIPHWIYPTALRRERALWRYLVLGLSGICLAVTLSGSAIGLHVWRSTRKRAVRDPYLRWHQTLGLWFGLFASTWLFSGALSLSPFHWADDGTPDTRMRRALYAAPKQKAAPDIHAAYTLCSRELELRELELTRFAGGLYAVCMAERETRIVDLAAPTEVMRALPTDTLRTLAADLAGGRAHDSLVQHAYDAYHYPTHGDPDAALPYVRVSVHDEAASTYYLDPARARLLGKHTRRTRLERWLYHGLHSFDFPALYAQPQLWRVWMLGAMGLGVALSGLGALMAVRRVLRTRRRRQRISYGS